MVREDFAQQGVGNLEAIELGLRQALLQDGRYLLEQLLVQAGGSLADNTSRPGERCHPDRTKPVQTIFGEIELHRRYFYHATNHTGRVPLDEALGLINGFSPGLVRLSAPSFGGLLQTIKLRTRTRPSNSILGPTPPGSGPRKIPYFSP